MITVVMPTYNASAFISQAVESILNQTFKDFELIIVDDGSTDNTLQILENYANQDKRIHVIQAQHGGPSRARNLAIEASQYPWIAIMDADDIALPHRLDTQIKLAQAKPHVVGWGAAVHHINACNEILSVGPLGPKTEKEFYQMRQAGHVVNLNHPTALLKKDVILKVGGYNPEFLAAQDLELLDRMASYGPILAIPEPLVLYRVHSQSISMQKFFVQRQAMRYVRARHLARLENRPTPTFEEFLRERHQLPWWKRAKKSLETLGMYHYRKTGLLIGEKQYLLASFHLAVSIACNPDYAIRRLRGQVLDSKTRQMIKKSEDAIQAP
jgi:glycosyltransferase involved in cell wall biosynthesis